MKKEDLAYLAGFVDADGSIGIVSIASSKQCVLKLSVFNRDYRVVKTFSKAFGNGKVRCRKHKSNWQPVYDWSVTANRALEAVQLLRPYLRIKHKQADLGIALQAIKRKNSSSEKRWNKKLGAKCKADCMRLKKRCNLLNKRGV